MASRTSQVTCPQSGLRCWGKPQSGDLKEDRPIDTAGVAFQKRKKAECSRHSAIDLCGCRECRWLGGNAPEDHGSGLLNGFQALAQETGVSVPKLDVVLG